MSRRIEECGRCRGKGYVYGTDPSEPVPPPAPVNEGQVEEVARVIAAAWWGEDDAGDPLVRCREDWLNASRAVLAFLKEPR